VPRGAFSYTIATMAKSSSAQKKSIAQAEFTTKEMVVKSSKPSKKTAPKKRSMVKKPVEGAQQKVDYYPNRMTLAISALAGTLIVLLALIAVLGQR